MPRRSVHVEGHVAAAPGEVWATARDFCGAWHPAIDTIEVERDAEGHLIRRFTVKGETTIYRERLIYFSDCDRTLGYSHLEGIRDAERYVGWFTVAPGLGGGSDITWDADVSATEARIGEIASGTHSVFEAGIAALAAVNGRPVASPPTPDAPTDWVPNSIILAGAPRTALDITPSKAGSLCLFLHGIGGRRQNWGGQLAAVRDVIQAAAMDLRGYGDSALGAAPSTVDDYCNDILRVMDEFSVSRVVLCGLSYGSWIATSFAIRHPEKVAGLVLSGGCTGMSEASAEERQAFRDSREIPLMQGKTPADFAPSVVKVLAGPRTSEAVRASLLDSMASIPTATYRDALQCFTNPREQFDFARLNMPVLLMTGEHDRLAPPSEIRTVARRIAEAAQTPNVRFEVIPDAGHVCNIEQPATYNRVLIEFLRELPQ